MIPLLLATQSSQSQKVEWWLPVLARENEELLFNRYRFYKMNRAMGTNGGDGHTTRTYLIPLNCIL